MQKLRWSLIVATVSTLTLAACGAAQFGEFAVRGHKFNVPRNNLLEDQIPWLPAAQSDGLNFFLNPTDEPPERILVNVYPDLAFCGSRLHPVNGRASSACPGSGAVLADKPVDSASLKKIAQASGATQWDYQAPSTGSGAPRVVVSCYAMAQPGRDGLCMALSTYQDLIFSIRFREADVSRLSDIEREIQAKLALWESRAR